MGTKIKDYIKNHKYVWLLAYWPIHGLWYAILQQTTMARAPYPIVSDIDYLIPFCEWMILPYVMWYLQLASTLLFVFWTNPKGAVRAAVLIMGGCFVAMLLCTAVPMYFDRTGMVMYQNDNLLTDLVKLLQGFDAPTTILPSMHVYVTWACHIVLCKEPWVAGKRLLKGASAFLSLTVTASTMLIKQHSAWDALSAGALLLIMYLVAYKLQHKSLMKLT